MQRMPSNAQGFHMIFQFWWAHVNLDPMRHLSNKEGQVGQVRQVAGQIFPSWSNSFP